MKTSAFETFAFVFTTTLALGSTLNVPQTYPTVQAAVSASVAGDIIVVAAGPYLIPAAACTLANGVQTTCGLVLHNGTTLTGSGPAQTLFDFSGATIGILLQSGTATVKLAHLQNAGTALYAYVGSNITAMNLIINNSHNGIELNQGNSYTIINTTIDGVHDGTQTGSGIDVPFDGSANSQNNLVTNSDRAFTASSFSGSFAYNDTFGSGVFDWGLCSAAGCTATTAPATNVSFDPMYCPDFSLQSGSPARNTGNPAILNPDGTRSDLGAYGGPGAILPASPCGGPPPPQLPDLSIKAVTPVQVVFTPNVNNDGISDLVLNKPTAFVIDVGLDQLSKLLAEQVIVQLQFENLSYRTTVNKADFIATGTTYTAKAFINPVRRILPISIGFQHVIVTIDPDNAIAESNEHNDSQTVTVDVKPTMGFEIAYIGISDCAPVGGCYGPLTKAAVSLSQQGTDPFILATYPVAPENFVSSISGQLFYGGLSGDITVTADMMNLWLTGRRMFPNAQRIIGLVPRSKAGVVGYFDFHGISAVGYSKPLLESVLVEEDHFTTAAHEIGHTFGLPVGFAEEYQLDATGDCVYEGRSAAGYWVDENSFRSLANNICFMGCRNDLLTTDMIWVDDVDFGSLFAQFRTQPNDPEIILFNGIFSSGGVFSEGRWYRIGNGVVSSPPQGAYSVQVLDVHGNEIASIPFDVNFYQFVDYHGKQLSNSAPIGIAIPYPPAAFRIRLRNSEITLREFNPQSKLLHDAVEALPDNAFAGGLIERRIALLNKVEAFDQLMQSDDLVDARNKLIFDIRPHLDSWLINTATSDPLNVTKQEILQLNDKLIARLARVMSN